MGKKVLILTNHALGLYNFRKELIIKLISYGYDVSFCCPMHDKVNDLRLLNAKYIPIEFNRREKNPFKDLILYKKYKEILKHIKPNLVLLYTIKPNVYGGFACKSMKIPYISTITGLGTVFQNKSITYYLVKILYKLGLSKANKVFFQNSQNLSMFTDNNIVDSNQSILVNGSGVNTSHFILKKDRTKQEITFLFIARMMKEKGIKEYLDAAEYIKAKYKHTNFQLLGFFEDDIYKERIKCLESKKVVEYLGISNDTRIEMAHADCIVMPSYHEGMSNVLLEGASTGLPLIATNIFGCKEAIEDGITGFLCEPKSSKSLVEAIEKFINLPAEERIRMGLAGRQKMKKEFERDLVIDKYMEAIEDIMNR